MAMLQEWFLVFLLLASRTVRASASDPTSYPPLSLFEGALVTTAKRDFNGHQQGFRVIADWDRERLRSGPEDIRAPHLACADYGSGREVFALLGQFLSPRAIRRVSNTEKYGACFIASCSHEQATALITDMARFKLLSVGPFPSALKLAPGLLDYRAADGLQERLSTVHGLSMQMENVGGVDVELTPNSLTNQMFFSNLLEDLMSESLDLHAINVWSDPAIVGGEHLATDEGVLLSREWVRAADVVHELSSEVGTSPGDICSWQDVSFHQPGDDVLLLSGMDHLLHSGRGVGGMGEEAIELHVACFMGLLSFLASRAEVLRVTPRHRKRLLNAAARANIQSATVISTPLTDAGLTGDGEVVQMVDAGLNETSCFFEDGDGDKVEHGYYFDEIGTINSYFSYTSDSFSLFKEIFTGGDFSYDYSRRKVIQYIDLIKSDSEDQDHGDATTTDGGVQYPFVPAGGFEQDDTLGHGTHVSGTVAGSTRSSSPTVVSCSTGGSDGCVGGCVSDDEDDDDDAAQLDELCSEFDCGGAGEDRCLGDDVDEILAEHKGMAPEAKLAIFDIFFGDYSYGDLAGNGLWEACMSAGCTIHSNSYGVDSRCDLGPIDLMYDEFMYENQEHLLVFAAGNDGWFTDRDGLCTVNAPGLAKNVLAVGSTSSGTTRLTTTNEDRKEASANLGDGTIDTISAFSSYGPTQDGRIKPEVLAPGDQIYSAGGGDDGYSCRLVARDGTSMATAVASGAAALVRQYFSDSSFYAKDVSSRDFCDGGFICDDFSPSAATVKAMLINSANLLGESAEPSDYRGFGRIHLEAGMPLEGEGLMALFVADSDDTSIEEETFVNYLFDVDADAGLELRATVSWIDPPATSLSATQLVNNIDLRIISPSGEKFYMWEENKWDKVNVNERVIVDADDITESGTWAVRVRSRSFSTDDQSYSLVVTGAISPPEDGGSFPRMESDLISMQSGGISFFYDDDEGYYTDDEEEQDDDDDDEGYYTNGDEEEQDDDDDYEKEQDDDSETLMENEEKGAASTTSPVPLVAKLLLFVSVYSMARVV